MIRSPRTLAPHLASLLAIALLATGCSLIGGSKQSPTIYAPEPVLHSDPAWPAVAWSLVVATPRVPRNLDNRQIVVSPVAGELQVYRAAAWSRTPGEMLQTSVLRTLEDSGKIAAVAREDSGIVADRKLLLEIRNFRSDYAGNSTPSALLEVNAKLVQQSDLRIIGNRTFHVAQPAAGVEPAQVSAAFAQALGQLGHDIAGWALGSGQPTH